MVTISLLALARALVRDFNDLIYDCLRTTKKDYKTKILIKPQKQRARKWPQIQHKHIKCILIYREHAWRRWLHNIIRPMEDEE